jgi:hypothetical protein
MAPVTTDTAQARSSRPEVRERSIRDFTRQQEEFKAARELQRSSLSNIPGIKRQANTPLDAATVAGRTQTTPNLSSFEQPLQRTQPLNQPTGTPQTANVAQNFAAQRAVEQHQAKHQGLVERRISQARYGDRNADVRARSEARRMQLDQQRVRQVKEQQRVQENRSLALENDRRIQDETDGSSNRVTGYQGLDPFRKTQRSASVSAEIAAGLDRSQGSVHAERGSATGPQGQAAINRSQRVTDPRISQNSISDTGRQAAQPQGNGSIIGGANLAARAATGGGTSGTFATSGGAAASGASSAVGNQASIQQPPGQAVARRSDTAAKWARLVTEQEVVDSNFDGEYRRQLAYMRTLTGEADMGLERDQANGVQVKSAADLDLNEIFAFRQGATQKTARRKFAVYHGFSLLSQMIAFWIISRAAHDKIREELELKGLLGEFVPSLELGDFVLEFVSTYEKALAMADGMPAEQARLLKTIEDTVNIAELKQKARSIRQKMELEFGKTIEFDSKR